MTGRPTELTRRTALRAGALAALAVPLAACGPGYDESPDPLQPLLAAAQADADAARALAKGADADVAGQLADARAAHAAALKSEVDRLNRPKPAPAPAPPPAPAALGGLKERLATARKQAEDLVGGLPRYRAGLVAAVAAGCAALQRTAPALGPGEDAPKVGTAPAGAVPPEAVDPLQVALAAEHAAVWVYGLVSAFLPGEFGDAEKSGAAEHALRRDYLQTTLSAAGATPVAPEAAYVPKNPVTDAKSASQVVATAEADCAAAWLAVIDHTDDAGLRTTALHALVAASRRGTPWRSEAGAKPVAIAMPGQSS